MNSAVHRRRHRIPPTINLLPMLDILFNLIFFFLLTTTIREDTAQMEVNLPGGQSGAPAEQADQIPMIYIQSGGQMLFKGRAMEEAELRLELTALVRQGIRRVRLAGDADAPWGKIFSVWDFCKLSGLDEVLMDYDRIPPGAPGSGGG
jgi:biopolymer transport protein ExbD